MEFLHHSRHSQEILKKFSGSPRETIRCFKLPPASQQSSRKLTRIARIRLLLHVDNSSTVPVYKMYHGTAHRDKHFDVSENSNTPTDSAVHGLLNPTRNSYKSPLYSVHDAEYCVTACTSMVFGLFLSRANKSPVSALKSMK